MSQADVVVPVYRNVALTRACVEAVLTHSGPALDRLWLVEDCSPEQGMTELLADLREQHPCVRVFRNARNLGFVQTANLGIAASERDVVVLNSDTSVTAGWLEELLAVLDAHPQVAALSPLSNNAGMCSVPNYGEAFPAARLPLEKLQLDGLPPLTEMPTAHGFCLLLRREALDELGPFDGAYGRGYHEENDWCQRARRAGWTVGRANRAFVFHEGEVSFQGERARLDAQNGWRLVGRYPQFFADTQGFDHSVSARLAARAVRASLGLLTIGNGKDCDVALLRPGQLVPSAAVPVVVLEDGDLPSLEAGKLDVLLAAAQGVVVSGATANQLAKRFPALRQCPAGEPTRLAQFASELVWKPEAAQSA